MISKVTTSVDYWFKNLGTNSLEPILPNLIKVPKVVEPTNKITWL